MKLLADGKPCELDSGRNITAWYLRRTRTEKEDFYGITREPVSDERVGELLAYFLEVGK